MNIEGFSRILNRTVVPSSLSVEEQERELEELEQFVSSNLPITLFRYRRCDERSIDAFYKDQVWASTSECMNDGFDARMYFDKKLVSQWQSQLFSDESRKSLIENRDIALPNGRKFFDTFGMEGVFPRIESMSQEEMESITKAPWEELREDSAKIIQELARITQTSQKISCFSETIKSPAMWGLYAADETGFALAYEFEKCGFTAVSDKGYSRKCMIFPVIYGKERYQVPDEFIRYLLQYRMYYVMLEKSGLNACYPEVCTSLLKSLLCPDLFMSTKLSLHKSIEWEKEQEWRLFCSSENNFEFTRSKHGCFIKPPVGLYLGRRMSDINQKILTDIAKEKGITVYKMRLNDDSPVYDLVDEAQ